MSIESRLTKIENEVNAAGMNKDYCSCYPGYTHVTIDGGFFDNVVTDENGLCRKCNKPVEVHINVVYVQSRDDIKPISKSAIANIKNNMDELLERGILLPKGKL